jgi:DNA mismatch repair protein MutL
VGSIHVLSEDLANKIAAGEVVERPASVVRELLENSLDAGAASITVEIEKAGRKLIKVSDDGRGMDEDDAKLSVERHATSKIISEGDLNHIETMGFRGEALPSIASVAKLMLKTAPEGADHGFEFEVIGGKHGELMPAATVGTTIEVRDLFFNTPARRKFLKRDQTELMHIIEVVTRLSVSHHNVGFRLFVEGQPTIDCPRAKDMRERLVQVYGAEFVEPLVKVNRDAGHLKISGYVSKPSGLRETRTNQLLFINRRPVRDSSISHAVFSAYDAPKGLHPVFFIFLEIDPDIIDVNVHPQKQEVRFSDKNGTYRFVRRSVGDSVRPLPSDGTPVSFSDNASPDSMQGASERSSSDAHYPDTLNAGYPMPEAAAFGGVSESMAGYDAFSASYSAETPHLYIGETFLSYPDGKGGLIVLDHHAAHERVLYEKFLKGLKLDSTMLLFPRQVELSKKEHMVMLDNLEMLLELGIEVEDFGGSSVIVRSLPEPLHEADMRGIIAEAVAAISDGVRPGKSVREAVAARIACHSSVRGARILTKEEFKALLEALDKTDDPEHCPHGRPTRLHFSLDELKKQFKRT